MIQRIRHSLVNNTRKYRNQQIRKNKWGTNIALISSIAFLSCLMINNLSSAPWLLRTDEKVVDKRGLFIASLDKHQSLRVTAATSRDIVSTRNVVQSMERPRSSKSISESRSNESTLVAANKASTFEERGVDSQVVDETTIVELKERSHDDSSSTVSTDESIVASVPFFGVERREEAAVESRERPLDSDSGTVTNTHGDKPPITRISLLGERNSGTNWMYDELQRCFNGTSLTVKRTLTRYKHWFQDEQVARDKKSRTLVVAQFRDPYYWVDAMHRKPHHATKHIHLKWKDFVTKPWTMDRVGKDATLRNRVVANATDPLGKDVKCQEHFRFHQIVSCVKRPFPEGYFGKTQVWSQHQPFYEMNPETHEPYESLLGLRRDKIKNLLSTADYAYVDDLLTVNYERLIDEGTGFVIRHIEEVTGVKALCEPFPPQEKRFVRRLEPDFVKWITDHIDWETEALIGYKKWTGDEKKFQ